MGLGKTGQGMVDPLAVVIKASRSGVGAESPAEAKARLRQERVSTALQAAKARAVYTDEMGAKFASAMRSKFAGQQCEKRLRMARGVLEDLDSRSGDTSRGFMWPEHGEEGSMDGDGDWAAQWQAAGSSEEKLVLVLSAIRQHHNYCVYCGTQYGDEEDMDAHCPGLLEEDHDE